MHWSDQDAAKAKKEQEYNNHLDTIELMTRVNGTPPLTASVIDKRETHFRHPSTFSMDHAVNHYAPKKVKKTKRQLLF